MDRDQFYRRSLPALQFAYESLQDHINWDTPPAKLWIVGPTREELRKYAPRLDLDGCDGLSTQIDRQVTSLHEGWNAEQLRRQASELGGKCRIRKLVCLAPGVVPNGFRARDDTLSTPYDLEVDPGAILQDGAESLAAMAAIAAEGTGWHDSVFWDVVVTTQRALTGTHVRAIQRVRKQIAFELDASMVGVRFGSDFWKRFASGGIAFPRVAVPSVIAAIEDYGTADLAMLVYETKHDGLFPRRAVRGRQGPALSGYTVWTRFHAKANHSASGGTPEGRRLASLITGSARITDHEIVLSAGTAAYLEDWSPPDRTHCLKAQKSRMQAFPDSAVRVGDLVDSARVVTRTRCRERASPGVLVDALGLTVEDAHKRSPNPGPLHWAWLPFQQRKEGPIDLLLPEEWVSRTPLNCTGVTSSEFARMAGDVVSLQRETDRQELISLSGPDDWLLEQMLRVPAVLDDLWARSCGMMAYAVPSKHAVLDTLVPWPSPKGRERLHRLRAVYEEFSERAEEIQNELSTFVGGYQQVYELVGIDRAMADAQRAIGVMVDPGFAALVQRLPSPIAVPIVKSRDSEEGRSRIAFHLHAAENAVRLVAAMALARIGQRPARLLWERCIELKTRRKGLSLGHWRTLAREAYKEIGGLAPDHTLLDDFVTERNRVAHRATGTTKWARDVEDRLQQLIDRLVREWETWRLGRLWLVRSARQRREGCEVKVAEITGTSMIPETMRFTVPRATHDKKWVEGSVIWANSSPSQNCVAIEPWMVSEEREDGESNLWILDAENDNEWRYVPLLVEESHHGGELVRPKAES